MKIGIGMPQAQVFKRAGDNPHARALGCGLCRSKTDMHEYNPETGNRVLLICQRCLNHLEAVGLVTVPEPDTLQIETPVLLAELIRLVRLGVTAGLNCHGAEAELTAPLVASGAIYLVDE